MRIFAENSPTALRFFMVCEMAGVARHNARVSGAREDVHVATAVFTVPAPTLCASNQGS